MRPLIMLGILAFYTVPAAHALVLADLAVNTSSTSLIVPISVIVTGIGIIIALLRVAVQMGISAGKLSADMEALTKALTSVKDDVNSLKQSTKSTADGLGRSIDRVRARVQQVELALASKGIITPAPMQPEPSEPIGPPSRP